MIISRNVEFNEESSWVSTCQKEENQVVNFEDLSLEDCAPATRNDHGPTN